MIRRQLPAYSPLSPGRLALAALDALLAPDAARAALRRHLAERFGAAKVCLTGSGTQALQLAIELAVSSPRGRGGVVALPAYSCYDVVTAAVGARARAVFYDIDPISLAPDMASLREALRSGATTVVAGYLHGFPLDWDMLRSECDASGAVLIEDAAQGLGSSWRGAEGGSFGDFTVLSFGRGKGWTGGGGGALAVRTALEGEAAERLTRVAAMRSSTGAGGRAAALSVSQWALGRPEFYGVVAAVPGTGLGETHYRDPSPVVGMPPFSAAASLRHADMARAMVAVRRDRARAWGALGAEVDRCVPLGGGDCGYLRYPILASDASTADSVASRAAKAGVVRGYPLALPKLDAGTSITIEVASASPGASLLADRLLTLPTHRFVSARDMDWVRSSVG